MLNANIINAATYGNWNLVKEYLNLNENTQVALVDLTESMLAAAANDEWKHVFLCLEIHRRSSRPIVNFLCSGQKLLASAHKKIFFLPDGSAQSIEVYLTKTYGVPPSNSDFYALPDMFFQAANCGDWQTVFYLIDSGLVDVNLENESDPMRRTVLDYATEQANFLAINGLLIERGGKESSYKSSLPTANNQDFGIHTAPVYAPTFNANTQELNNSQSIRKKKREFLNSQPIPSTITAKTTNPLGKKY